MTDQTELKRLAEGDSTPLEDFELHKASFQGDAKRVKEVLEAEVHSEDNSVPGAGCGKLVNSQDGHGEFINC